MQSTQQMIHVKATFGQDIRRFETEVNYSSLVNILRTIFHLPTATNFITKFLDDDQDWITFSSDAEFRHAAELKLNPLKLTFEISNEPIDSVPSTETTEEKCEKTERVYPRRSHETAKGCHQGRWGEMKEHHGGCREGRRCHPRAKWGEMKGCHEGRGFYRGNEEEGPRERTCGRKGNCRGMKEGRFHPDSSLPFVEKITQRIDIIQSKLDQGVEDEQVREYLTFRLAKLQSKKEFFQQRSQTNDQCTENNEKTATNNPRESIKILELKQQKQSIRQKLRASREAEDEESILRLREELMSTKCSIRKLKIETFGDDYGCCGRKFNRPGPSPSGMEEDFKHCKVDKRFRLKRRSK